MMLKRLSAMVSVLPLCLAGGIPVDSIANAYPVVIDCPYRGITMLLRFSIVFLVMSLAAPAAFSQTGPWKPIRSVEIVVGVGPGGGIDRTARLMQKILQDHRLIDVASTVVNKPGGGSTISLAYLSQHPGDAHLWEISATSILTNQITGKSALGYKDFTPVAMLYDEYIGFLVREDSPLKTGKDLLNA